ncbi:TPA: hypothetical protein ACJXGQ_001433 [Streptococcus pneumoniae]
MAKVQFTIKNDKGEDVLKKSKEITTRDYRDYLVMNDSLTSDLSEVEKLDKQLGFIASLFDDVTVEQLLEYTDFAKVISIFTDIYAHLVGDVDPKEKWASYPTFLWLYQASYRGSLWNEYSRRDGYELGGLDGRSWKYENE